MFDPTCLTNVPSVIGIVADVSLNTEQPADKIEQLEYTTICADVSLHILPMFVELNITYWYVEPVGTGCGVNGACL